MKKLVKIILLMLSSLHAVIFAIPVPESELEEVNSLLLVCSAGEIRGGFVSGEKNEEGRITNLAFNATERGNGREIQGYIHFEPHGERTLLTARLTFKTTADMSSDFGSGFINYSADVAQRIQLSLTHVFDSMSGLAALQDEDFAVLNEVFGDLASYSATK